MDSLSIPTGAYGEVFAIGADDIAGKPAVSFDLPEDGRVIAREHIPGLIEWLQGFYKETQEPLPTLPHATIRATVTVGQEQAQNVVLSRMDDDGEPWRAAEAVYDTRWFDSESIVSFEVLFPGVEA